jgi:hydrogenase-4 component B
MPSASLILSGTAIFWILTCILTACFHKSIRNPYSYPAFALFLGGVTMLIGAVLGWQSDITWSAPAPIYLAGAPLSCHVDPLSSIFIGLLAVVTISVSLFSPGYLVHLEKSSNPACYWVQMFFFVASMMGVLLASNALTFLLAWETMAISSVLLVATNLSSHESRSAAFIYLGATRVATALLMAGFLWMYALFHSWDFSAWHFYGYRHLTAIPAVLILIGLCIKAGIWPFHVWLPYAHPAAPAPVSALMSGVMIKVALYAIIRILVMQAVSLPLVGYFMLALGVISAFWGILFALQQNDLKTLLAYSSIENVGLVLAAIGLSMVSQRLHLNALAGLALCAAIFHCINHGMFKSLLFLGAGAIDIRAHTRNLEHLGGLGRLMPNTMLFFLIGSAALCALPPLNGFSSKWLLYKSIFDLACLSHDLWISGLAAVCIGFLAIVGALAVACFTKAVGFAFLGRARSKSAERAGECTIYMQTAQALLAFACVALGLSAPRVMAAIQPVVDSTFVTNSINLASVYDMPMVVFAITLAILTFCIYTILLAGRQGGVKHFITWECGFGDLSQRMQGTATSFAENFAATFAPLYQYRVRSNISGRDRRHFPEAVATEVDWAPLLETRVYIPSIRLVRWLGEHMLLLQAGSVHLYLGYMLLTLVTLMVVGILI